MLDKSDFFGWWLASSDNLKRMLSTMNYAYGNPMDSDDLLSEVFLRCWNGHLKDDTRGYRPWVWGVARNVLCKQVRTLAQEHQAYEKLLSVSVTTPYTTIEDRFSSNQDIENLCRAANSQVKRNCLAVSLALTKADGDVPSHSKIAKHMGISQQRVSQIMAEIREDLIRAKRSEDVRSAGNR